MDKRTHFAAVAVQPLEQVIWTNDVMQPNRADVPPFVARSEEIANNNAFPGLCQLDRDVRSDEPSPPVTTTN